MARLCSVSCGPLPVLLLLLLLLDSVPAMASVESALGAVRGFRAKVEKVTHTVQGLVPQAQAVEHFPLGAANVPDEVGKHLVGWTEKLTPYALRKMNAPEDFIKGVKGGFKACKILNKISKLVNQEPGGYTIAIIPDSPLQLPVLTVDITATDHTGLCGPDVAVGLHDPPVPSRAVVGFGNGGELSQTFPKFSYQVHPDGTAAVWLPTTLPPQGMHLGEWSQLATTTIPLYTNPVYPRDGRYYVEVTGIQVGENEVVQTPTLLGFRLDGTGGVYLSTTEPYTYLESGVYVRLKAVLMRQIQGLNPEAVPTSLDATRELCYVRAELTVPPMVILFADNAAMNLGEATNMWYGDGPAVCLAILPTYLSLPGQASIIGSWMQSGRTMTIDAAASTLTF